MHYQVWTFTQITRAQKPTREQVAAALATSYAIGRGSQVPVHEHICEEIDEAELLMGATCVGVVEADTELEAVQKVMVSKLLRNGRIAGADTMDLDQRYFVTPIRQMFAPNLEAKSITEIRERGTDE